MNTESAKHTTGPWIAKKIQLGVDDYFFEVYGGSPPHEICQTIVRDVSREQAWLDEDEANARLIAAGPELLKALKDMLRLTEQDREGALMLSRADWEPLTNGEQDVIDRAFIAAEAAIKKAEGEL